MKPDKLISIIGPTASGKTELALLMASEFAGEIINVDSLNLYKHFDIGTAKPSINERNLICHHLIDILEPEQAITVVDFVCLAERAIEIVRLKSKVPILVAGSPLYFYSLTRNSFNPPPTDNTLRNQLIQRAESEGLESLYLELKEKDLSSTLKINSYDRKRIIRALEVFYITGHPFSTFRKSFFTSVDRYPLVKVGLKPGRVYLKDRIMERTNKMINQGLFEETRNIIREGISINAPAFESIGYKEALRYINDGLSLEEVKNCINMRTYKYAKHQMTWFKRDKDILWFEYDSNLEFKEVKDKIILYLRERYD
ncbi:MAG: tRNA dimethylallyltransferase [candidate division WS2 bacterium]|nr:tRNA dimethylallyltransferase [Candidatus Lithacetigena glycinireducens]